MSAPKLTKKTEVFLKVQSGDAFEAPLAADNIRTDVAAEATQNAEVIERNIAQSSLSNDADIVGIKPGQFTFSHEFHGAPDYAGGDLPPCNAILIGSGFQKVDAFQIPGAVATPPVFDEILTGQTSGATLQVLDDAEASDSRCLVLVLTGTPEAAGEVFDGSISGVGCFTSSSAETKIGHLYTPISENFKRLSGRIEKDGLKYELFNSAATFNLTGEDSNIAKFDTTVIGAINIVNDVPQWQIDAPLTTGITRSNVKPAIMQKTKQKYGDYTGVISGTISQDMAIETPILRDANQEFGVEGAFISARNPMMSYRLRTPSQADLDIMADFFNSNTVRHKFRIGKNDKNSLIIHARAGVLTATDNVDQDGIMMQELTIKLTGQDNNEISYLFI